MNRVALKSASRGHSGFSLVELMVAMTIGLLIFSGVMAVFIRSNTQYHTTNSTARLQENARAAMTLITRDLRLAGYAGCQPMLADAKVVLNAGGSYSPLSGTEGCAATGSCSASDALSITQLDPNGGASLTATMTSSSQPLSVSTPNSIGQGEIVGIGDCDTLDIAQVSSVQAGGATLLHEVGTQPLENSKATLQKTYEAGALVMKLKTTTFSVATGSTGQSTLFRSGQEMVDGIENLQVLYGVWDGSTTDRIPVNYVTADNVTNWGGVVSVRIGLLVNSIADTASGEYGESNNANYTVLDKTIAPPAERRIRKVFVSTVQLRNLPQ